RLYHGGLSLCTIQFRRFHHFAPHNLRPCLQVIVRSLLFIVTSSFVFQVRLEDAGGRAREKILVHNGLGGEHTGIEKLLDRVLPWLCVSRDLIGEIAQALFAQAFLRIRQVFLPYLAGELHSSLVGASSEFLINLGVHRVIKLAAFRRQRNSTLLHLAETN